MVHLAMLSRAGLRDAAKMEIGGREISARGTSMQARAQVIKIVSVKVFCVAFPPLLNIFYFCWKVKVKSLSRVRLFVTQ